LKHYNITISKPFSDIFYHGMIFSLEKNHRLKLQDLAASLSRLAASRLESARDGPFGPTACKDPWQPFSTTWYQE